MKTLISSLFIAVATLALPCISEASCTSGNPFGRPSDNVQLCFNYGTDFDDVGGGEDLWPANGARAARGVRAKIIRVSDGAIVWGAPDGTYTDKDTGCTPVIPRLSGPGPFIVRIYSQAQVTTGGVNTIEVRTSQTDNQRFYYNLTTTYNPSSNLTCTYTWDNSTTALSDGSCPVGQNCTVDLVNLAAAAGYTMDQHYGGLHGKLIKIFTEPCTCQTNSPGACACDSPDSTIYLKFPDDGTRGRKFIIAHELGHAVSILRNTGRAITYSSADPYPASGPCDMDGNAGTHTLVSQLWQGKAAHEGFAHFWASAVWNIQLESDCAFAYCKSVDLDQNGTNEINPWVNCVGGGTVPAVYPAADYMHSKCNAPYAGKATEFDWMRAWAVLHRQGVTTSVIADIWDGANPHTWLVAFPSTNPDSAYYRLDASAYANLTTAQYQYWDLYTAAHGVTE